MNLKIFGKNKTLIELDLKEKQLLVESSDLNQFKPQQLVKLVYELSSLAWVPVGEELPENPGYYQVLDSEYGLSGCHFIDRKFTNPRVTHWQPLAKVKDL